MIERIGSLSLTRLPIREKAHCSNKAFPVCPASPEGTGAYQQFMKTKLNLFQARLFCAVTLGIGSSFGLTATAVDSAGPAPAKTSIPWSQIGAKAGADYQGDGLAVSPIAGCARLRCVFQRFEGEATREGWWLTSTAIPPSGTVRDRFRVVATSVGRQSAMAGDERLVPMSLRESSARRFSSSVRSGM